MFERRLRIILLFLGLAALGLAGRAGQIQLVQNRKWGEEASDFLTRHQFIETVRGRILDRKGRELAVDEACIDACVDYPAIIDEPDEKWLREQAIASAKRRFGSAYEQATRAKQKEMIGSETEYVRERVQALWKMLAQVSGKSDEEINEIRRTVIDRVEMRRQYVSWQNYQRAVAKQKSARPTTMPWYSRWWPSNSPDELNADDYAVDVAEQNEAHVILPAIDTKTFNELAKNAEDLPGLILRPGRQRVYPFHNTACHVLGRIGPVDAERIKSDGETDPLRKYWPNDLAGEGGAEAAFESMLRGSRGELTDQVESNEPIPGRDVKLSIDVDVQSAIEHAFSARYKVTPTDGSDVQIRQNQPGAAVVIDIATGQVLALVSNPTFDPNNWEKDFPRLSLDDANAPLLNRALQPFEPGSTIKPLMALAALRDGIITPTSTIDCNGYLMIDGRRVVNGFRCWTMSEFGLTHHEVPEGDPLPSNSLTVVDAIERSCDVFFETTADRMGMARQRYWCDRFGLGRPTGFGLPESAGQIPNPARIPRALIRESTWLAGTGQGPVRATPLQMANVAATIARGGVWMRPTLLDDASQSGQQVDLGFSPEAIAAVKAGMWAVVNKEAGTMKLQLDETTLAGKTGTAQASILTVPVRDADGKIVMENGREKRVAVDPNSASVRTWYIGENVNGQMHYAHAWFIGYAPAEKPRVAISVFIEYGQLGGVVAGPIVRAALDACAKGGYLK